MASISPTQSSSDLADVAPIVPRAMTQAGAEMGLSAEQARRLAVGTFAGASELARASSEPLATLRERVTSKGGTTYAALTSLEADRVKAAFVKALHAADQRAAELLRNANAPFAGSSEATRNS